MKSAHAAAISTAIVISLGILMIVPPLIQIESKDNQLTLMLSFSVIDDSNALDWCNELSSFLNENNIKATVFFTGKVADQYPECVSTFSNDIDIGSQTYRYVDLTTISDYTLMLEEVRSGKLAVDSAGKLHSRLFKAPYGTTDENIYSLLSRSNIVADFSYDDHYNKYNNGQFIKFDLRTYFGIKQSAEFFLTLNETEIPIIINFDNSTPINQISEFVCVIKSGNFRFVNASEITGFNLTIRDGELF